MRKLILGMSISFDGFVAGPNGEVDWIFRNRAADSTAWIINNLEQTDAIAMGSRSYYEMAAFWPYSNSPFTSAMNGKPKIIFSRNGLQTDVVTRALADAKTKQAGEPQPVTPRDAALRSWAEPMVAGGDLVEEITRLKEQPGDYISAIGGARFAQNLAASGLVDEYRLVVHPIALGRGQSLFSALPSHRILRLISTTTFSTGAVGVIYRNA